MHSKKRILFVGEAVSLAHVTRPLILAQSLDRERYEIHFACDLRYESLISGSPYVQYWPIRSIPSRIFVKAADRGEFAYRKSDLEFYLKEELDLIKNARPSFIVGDYRYTLSTSSELSRIPYAAIANIHWSPYRVIEPLKVSNVYGISTKIRAELIYRLFPFLYMKSLACLNNIRKSYGLSPLKDLCDLITHADYTLYADVPDWVQTMPMPSNHLFLGPILWSPSNPKPQWWETWNSRLPLIYVSLGSTGAIKRLKEIVLALARFPVVIVVTTAGRTMLRNMPPNVYIADYLPGTAVCKRASVVLCSGGSATAYQSLSQGAPVVGIWSNEDQYLTMRMIERAGAGLGCAARNVNNQKIKHLVTTVLENSSYQGSALNLAESFKQYDSCQRFRQFLSGLEKDKI